MKKNIFKLLIICLLSILFFSCSKKNIDNQMSNEIDSIEETQIDKVEDEKVSRINSIADMLHKNISENYGDNNGKTSIDYNSMTLKRTLYRAGIGAYLKFYLDNEFDQGHNKLFVQQWDELRKYVQLASKESKELMDKNDLSDCHYELWYMDDRIYARDNISSDSNAALEDINEEEHVLIKAIDGEIFFDLTENK